MFKAFKLTKQEATNDRTLKSHVITLKAMRSLIHLALWIAPIWLTNIISKLSISVILSPLLLKHKMLTNFAFRP